MEKELDFDRHFYLYSKLHYKITNTMDDLKVLMSKRSGIELEYVRSIDAMNILLNLAYKQMSRGVAPNNGQHIFFEFISDLLPSNWWKCGRAPKAIMAGKDYAISESDMVQAVCAKCLSILGNSKIVDIDIELGEADPEILPLREKPVTRAPDVAENELGMYRK